MLSDRARICRWLGTKFYDRARLGRVSCVPLLQAAREAYGAWPRAAHSAPSGAREPVRRGAWALRGDFWPDLLTSEACLPCRDPAYQVGIFPVLSGSLPVPSLKSPGIIHHTCYFLL